MVLLELSSSFLTLLTASILVHHNIRAAESPQRIHSEDIIMWRLLRSPSQQAFKYMEDGDWDKVEKMLSKGSLSKADLEEKHVR